MMPGERRDDRVPEPRLDGGQDQHVSGADREAGRNQRIGARTGLARIDAGA